MNHPHILKKLCCVTCQTTGMFSVTDTQIVCGHCHTNYPFISGQIPVLVKHPEKLLIHAYKEYTSYIGQQNFLISRLKNQAVKSTYRSAETKNLLAKAIEVNTGLIEKIKNLIKPYVELDKVLNTPASNELHYLSNFDYIRRDWSGQPRAEAEIIAIKRIVEGFFTKNPPEKENAVFLGAGTGRVAWELKDYFEQTYALDNSMTMIVMFNELLRHDLELYEINYKNCLKSEEICKPYSASINHSKVSKTRNYFAFVGDASALPFADASVANVFSIYFTDVLPLKNFNS